MPQGRHPPPLTHGDPLREALSFALENGYFGIARREERERKHWAARGTVTL